MYLPVAVNFSSGNARPGAVKRKNVEGPLGDEWTASGLVGDDREALGVCDWEPVLSERADLAADDGG